MHFLRGLPFRLTASLAASLLVPAGIGAAPPALTPGTYVGVLPCADCAGLRYELELRRDQTYVLRNIYLGKGPREPGKTVFDDIGRWLLSTDGAVLAIKGAREAPEYFALSGKALRKLDLDAQPIESPANHLLERSRNAVPLEPRLPMQGLLTQGVDAALFTECATGVRWTIANEADWLAAERALAKARDDAKQKPAAPLLVSLDGKLNGSSIVIDRFNAVLADKPACDAPFTTLPLLGTVWSLVRLGIEAGATPHASYGAQMQLSPGRPAKVNGWTGCNRLISSAQLQASTLRFGPQTASRVACVAAQAEPIESGLLAALADARYWRALGALLELHGEDHKLLARFEGKLAR